jgi:hypothetical protein
MNVFLLPVIGCVSIGQSVIYYSQQKHLFRREIVECFRIMTADETAAIRAGDVVWYDEIAEDYSAFVAHVVCLGEEAKNAGQARVLYHPERLKRLYIQQQGWPSPASPP